MALVTHALVTYPEVQERLYQEISDAIAANNGDPCLDYNTIQSLPLLDQASQWSVYTCVALAAFCQFKYIHIYCYTILYNYIYLSTYRF
jgi:hypothetical protein